MASSLRRLMMLTGLLVSMTTLQTAAQCISGTRISTTSGDTTVLTCPGDGRADLITFQPNTFTFFYAYVLTNEDNMVLTYSTDAAINFEGATQQDFRVWGLSYSGNLTIDPGVMLSEISLADGCYELSSNFVTVKRSIPASNQVTIIGGSRVYNFCRNDDQRKNLSFRNTSDDASSYAYLITNTSNRLVAISETPNFDFGTLPEENYRVWGVAYRGELVAESNDNVQNARLASQCHTLSSNFVRINYRTVEAGTVATSDSLTTVEVCGEEVDNPLRFNQYNTGQTTYRMVVTDTMGVVQKILSTSEALQVNDLAPNTYHIWGVAFANGLLLSRGDTLQTAMVARSCWDISDNFIELIRPAIIGGTIATISNADTLYNCIDNADATFNFNQPTSAASYDFVVLDKNGAIVSIKTSSSFQLNDLEGGIYTVYGMAFDGNRTAQVGDTLENVSYSDGCYDRSENFVTVNRSNPNGGTISLQSGETSAYFCPDGENPDKVFLQVNNKSGIHFKYVVTDENDEVITTTTADSVAFAEIGMGIFRVYGLASANEVVLEEGEVISAGDCAAISENFLTVVRQDAIGGEIKTTEGEEVLFSCPATDGPETIAFATTGAFGNKSAYIMTNVNGYVIDYLDTTTYDLSNLDAGEYRIYHLSYAGELLDQTDQQIEVVPHASSCYGLSENFLLIYREEPRAGLVASATFETTVEVCIGADNSSGLEVVNSSNGRTDYAYIVTNEDGEILDLPESNIINFEAYGANRSRVYGAAFTGNFTAQIGENIEETVLSNECAVLSINYITVIPKVVDGGRIFNFQNEETLYICGDDGSSDYIGFYADTQSDAEYRYLITDENNTVIKVMAGNLENFDVAGPATKRVWGISFMGNLTARVGLNVQEDFLATECYALSENYLEIIRTSPSSSQVTTADGATNLNLCAAGDAPQWVQLATEGQGNSPYRYLVTDDANTILAMTDTDSLNLTEVEGSSFRVYGVSYLGDFSGAIGDDVTDTELAENCFSLSNNFLTIERTVTEGGRVTLPFEETIAYLCPDDEGADVLSFFTNSTADANYRYVITNLENTIVRVVNGSLQNFSNLGTGSFRVYGVSYTGEFLAEAGDDIRDVQLFSECYDISTNFASVNRITPAAGEVETIDGETRAIARVSNGEPDVIIFNMPDATSSRWRFVVTNNQKEVLELSEAARFNFENYSVGFYRVYGIVHTGELTLEVGDILGDSAPADGCFDISENYVEIVCALNLNGTSNALQLVPGTTPTAQKPKIAPNPAVNTINLTFESSVNETSRIRIFDLSGKLMLEQKVETTEGFNQIDIRIDGWDAGKYYVQIINSGKNLTTSFIKHNL